MVLSGHSRFDVMLHKKFIQVLLAVLLLGSGVAAPAAELSAREQRFADTRAQISREFPSVRHITIDEYQQRYPGALLIDVRSAEEFAVSRIPGALHAGSHPQLLRLVTDLRTRQPEADLLLYCSLGWRSARAASYLQQQGVDGLMNLQGSIFAWGNRGLALEDGQGPVQRVHPYNRLWGWLYLDETLRR